MRLSRICVVLLLAGGCTDNTSLMNQEPTCVGGRQACNGVCVDTRSDPGNCGSCGKACDQGSVCANGACQIVCPAGLTQCDRSCVDVNNDRAHCGGCANACTDTQVCASGQCAVSCPNGQTNCDGVCADLTSDAKNCSACGKACAGEGICVMGQCMADCMMPLIGCGAVCIDPNNDPNNCGMCGNVCKAPANHINYCAMGMCVVGSCLDGWFDCNGDSGDGCEANIGSDPKNCGGCFNECPQPPHEPFRCTMGMCTPSGCDVGFGDCNMDPNDGCEVDLNNDVNNCGKCSNACVAPPHIALMCVKGICQMGGCETGWTDCNGDPNDGCEVNTGADPNNCGMCGNVCPMNMPYCGNGVCTTLFVFQGVQQNVPVANLGGWTQCFIDHYGDFGPPLTQILNMCNGNKLLLACRKNGNPILQLAAMGNRADVLFDCGQQQNCTHQAGGVGWYYNDSYSWGFVPAGDAVSRNSCDIGVQQDAGLRLCWHTGGGQINGGFRCGSDEFLNGDQTFERIIYQAN